MTKIINLIGGPGVGKSTIASGLFSELKQRKVSCEYVSEYAKEVTWEQTHKLLENQIHVFSEQFRRQYRLLGQVDYVITDSPLLLNTVYFNYYLEKNQGKDWFNPKYQELCRNFFNQTFNQFDNLNYFITRNKEYDKRGRNQDFAEALGLDYKIWEALRGIKYQFLDDSEKENINKILGDLNVRSI